MTMNRMYQPQSETDRLYISIKEGERGLLSITDYVETEEQNLFLYLHQSEEKLLRFSKSERILSKYEGPVSLQLRNIKTKKETSNGKRNNSMVNL